MREIFEGMVDESAVAPAIQPTIPGGPAVSGTTWEEISELEPDPGNPLASIMQMEGGTLSGESEIDLDRGILLRSNVRTEMMVSALGQETRIVAVQTIELVEP